MGNISDEAPRMDMWRTSAAWLVDERDISEQKMMDGDLLNQKQWSGYEKVVPSWKENELVKMGRDLEETRIGPWQKKKKERKAREESLKFDHFSPYVLHLYLILFYSDSHTMLLTDTWMRALTIDCVEFAPHFLYRFVSVFPCMSCMMAMLFVRMLRSFRPSHHFFFISFFIFTKWI